MSEDDLGYGVTDKQLRLSRAGTPTGYDVDGDFMRLKNGISKRSWKLIGIAFWVAALVVVGYNIFNTEQKMTEHQMRHSLPAKSNI